MKKLLLNWSLRALLLVNCAAGALASPGPGPEVYSLGDSITLNFDKLGSIVRGDKQNITNVTLFLNDLPMHGLHPKQPSYASNLLSFELVHTKDNSDQWRSLFRSTPGFKTTLRASVGFEDDLEHVTVPNNPNFYWSKISSMGWIIAAIVIVVAVLLLLFIYGAKSNLLRESTPVAEKEFELRPIPLCGRLPGMGEVRATGRQRPPFSLGRVQMAVWFVVIFISYIFLWLVLNERNSFNTTALTLLGITLVTGLVSRAIDVGKQDNVGMLEAERNQVSARKGELEGKTPPLPEDQKAELARLNTRLAEVNEKLKGAVISPDAHTSDGFFMDILSDQNGISLQRLQMVGWTLILCLVFVDGVLKNLAMPDFDNTLLGLMGISSGAFLGFKVPEKNAVPREPEKGK